MISRLIRIECRAPDYQIFFYDIERKKSKIHLIPKLDLLNSQVDRGG